MEMEEPMNTENTLTIVPEHDELQTRADSWPEKATALKVVDATTYTEAGHLLTGVKALRKEVAETFGPICKKTDAAHKEAVKTRKTVDGPLISAEAILKSSMNQYNEDQENKREAEQRRLDAEARRREEDRRLSAAADLEDEGNSVEAERVFNTPAPVVAVVAAPVAPKVAGVSTRKTWKARVVDKQTALEYVVANFAVFGHLVDFDSAKLDRMARDMDGQIPIEAIETYQERGISAGSR